MRDNSRQSQDSQLSDSHIAELTFSRQVPCEQLAYVPDDESSSELIPETSLKKCGRDSRYIFIRLI